MWISTSQALKKAARLLAAATSCLLLLFIAGFLTGCSTVQSKPKPNVDLSAYKKVIIAPIDGEGDPRKVIPKVAEQLRALGFEIYMPKPGEPIATQGSGLVVDLRGHILTCAHVLAGMTNATVWIGPARFDAEVVNVDTNRDMALLRLKNSTNVFVPLAFASDTNLSMGQDVFTMGFPLSDVLGSAPRLTKGLLSSTVGMSDNPDFVQISAEVQAGNSGGPLLNGKSEVIGLITSTLNPLNVLIRTGTSLPQNVNFAAKVGITRSFLAQSGITPKIAKTGEAAWTFDKVKESIALVRAGYISPDGPKAKELLCSVKYIYFWDMWYRFRVFQIDFNDLSSGDLILRVGQYGDKVFTNEDAVIESVIAETRRNFFPTQAVPSPGAPTTSSGNRR